MAAPSPRPIDARSTRPCNLSRVAAQPVVAALRVAPAPPFRPRSGRLAGVVVSYVNHRIAMSGSVICTTGRWPPPGRAIYLAGRPSPSSLRCALVASHSSVLRRSARFQSEQLSRDIEYTQDALKRGLAEDVVERQSLSLRTDWRIGTPLLTLLIYNATEPSIFGVVIYAVRGPLEFLAITPPIGPLITSTPRGCSRSSTSNPDGIARFASARETPSMRPTSLTVGA
jgi:hypothetical protein